MLDLIGRLIIIERKDAIRWGIDPAALKEDTTVAPPAENSFQYVPETELAEKGDVTTPSKEDIPNECSLTSRVSPSSADLEAVLSPGAEKAPHADRCSYTIRKVAAHAGCLLPYICPCVKCFIPVLCPPHLTTHRSLTYSTQEPSIPVHLQHVWGLDSKNVGLVFICTAVSAFICESYHHEDITKLYLRYLFGCMNSFSIEWLLD